MKIETIAIVVAAWALIIAGNSPAQSGTPTDAATRFEQIPDHDVKSISEASSEAGWTFKVRENWVTDYLKRGGSITGVTGYKPQEGWKAKARFAPVMQSVALPAHFDWRDEVPGAFEPARNQGSCGSCWAFSTTGVVETAYAIANPGKKIDLSEQSIVACSGSGNCSGGYFDALDYMKTTGVADESQDPYQGINTKCKAGLKPMAKIASWEYIGDGTAEPTIDEMKTAIFLHGPISVTVDGSFSSYSSGIYNKCSHSATNHMVIIIGWDDKNQYWIMRNSWGADWGEEGYMRIKWEGSPGKKCNNLGEVAAYVVFDKP